MTPPQITTDLLDPRVVGVSDDGVFVTGIERVNESDWAEPSGRIRRVWDQNKYVVHYGLDGRERKRWRNVFADYVVDGIVIRTRTSTPKPGSWSRGYETSGACRLEDQTQEVYRYLSIQRWDRELVWGSVDLRTSELRRVSGELIERFDADLEVTDVAWDEAHIYVYAKRMAWTIERATMTRSRLDPPEPSSVISVEAVDETVSLDMKEHRWIVPSYKHRAVGLEVLVYGTLVLVGKQWPNTVRRAYQLQEPIMKFEAFGSGVPTHGMLTAIDVMPPWIVFHRAGMPMSLVLLAELDSFLPRASLSVVR